VAGLSIAEAWPIAAALIVAADAPMLLIIEAGAAVDNISLVTIWRGPIPAFANS
jgi:hypothetical protein